MSTELPPLDDLDLSAVLDGEADEAVLERLSADPAAQARLGQIEAVRALVATAPVPEPSADQVDALVATAIAAADIDPTSGAHGAPNDTRSGAEHLTGTTPVPASRRSRAVPPWLVAAAVVVLVALGLSLVWMGRDADTQVAFDQVGASIDSQATSGADAGASRNESFDDDAEAPDTAAAEMAPDALLEDAPSGAPTTTGPRSGADVPTLVHLGEFSDVDALREHLREGFPADPSDGSLPETGIEDDLAAAFRCLGKVDGLFEPAGDPTDVGLAIVDGQPNVVYDLPYVTDEGRETTLVIAVDEVSCIPVLAFQR